MTSNPLDDLAELHKEALRETATRGLIVGAILGTIASASIFALINYLIPFGAAAPKPEVKIQTRVLPPSDYKEFKRLTERWLNQLKINSELNAKSVLEIKSRKYVVPEELYDLSEQIAKTSKETKAAIKQLDSRLTRHQKAKRRHR